MVKTFMRKKSKRLPAKMKYKIDKKVREHKRKLRKSQKNGGKSKLKKDPGIPNLYPFKEHLLKQIEEKRENDAAQKQRDKERRKREKKLQSLQGIQQAALKSSKLFDKKQEWEEAADEMKDLGLDKDSSRKAYYREFKKVVDLSDVILEVLDARDPLGCRCPQLEQAVISSGANKKLVLVINKIDLVPRSNVEDWLKYLRDEFPAIPFKASTQAQKQHLSRKKLPASSSKDIGNTAVCIGAEVLMNVLGNYCRNTGVKTSITVGIVGLPNVGKSSIINSLKRSKACQVGAIPGVTKAMQEIQLDKHIKLLDSPGIVMATSSHHSAVLRNCLKVDSLSDVVTPVETILQRCNKLKMVEFYTIADYSSTQEFLSHVARRHGRLKKGGRPDVDAAAKLVLHDWNNGKITFYTHPPERPKGTHTASEIVQEWSKEFDLASLEVATKESLSGLKDTVDSSAMIIESSQPVDMEEMSVNEMDEESDDYDDEDDSDEDIGDVMNATHQKQLMTVELSKSSKGKRKVSKKDFHSSTGQPNPIDGDVDMQDDEYMFTEYFN